MRKEDKKFLIYLSSDDNPKIDKYIADVSSETPVLIKKIFIFDRYFSTLEISLSKTRWWMHSTLDSLLNIFLSAKTL